MDRLQSAKYVTSFEVILCVKKLRVNQKIHLDKAVQAIMKEPNIGQLKTGDLSGIFTYKFKMNKQLSLLAYTYKEQTVTLTLLALSPTRHYFILWMIKI